MSEKPPREFWIVEGSDVFGHRTLYVHELKLHNDSIPVIEKSAYDELERKGQQLCVGLGNTMMEAEKLRKERDAWKGQALALGAALAILIENTVEDTDDGAYEDAQKLIAQFEAFKKSLNE